MSSLFTSMRPPVAHSIATGLALGVALASAAAATGDGRPGARSVEMLLERFAAMPGMSARFTEEKRMSLLEEPLESHGAIWYAPPDRLVRKTLAPIPSTIWVTRDRLAFGDDERSESIDFTTAPEARLFTDSFTRILAGDLPGLERLYAIEFDPEGDEPWRLRLEPSVESLRRAITSIVVQGRGMALEEMRILEVSGDETVTRFLDVDANHRFDEAELSRIFERPDA